MMTHRPQFTDQKLLNSTDPPISICANDYLEPFKANFNPTEARPAARLNGSSWPVWDSFYRVGRNMLTYGMYLPSR